MTQTEYLIECGAPPLPKGWRYEVRLVPDYNEEKDRWYTIVKVRVQDENDKILGQFENSFITGFYQAYATARTIETAAKAYKCLFLKPELDPRELTSLPFKEK